MGDETSPPSAVQWLGQFCAAAGTEPPSDEEIEQILKLAAVAAHSSERIAAPVACWIAGRLGIGLDAARALAESLDDQAG